MNRRRIAARWSGSPRRWARTEGRGWSPPASASASRPARHRAATSPATETASRRSWPRPPTSKPTLPTRTAGIRVRIPTGPALIGNGNGPGAEAVQPHRRHPRPHPDRPGADRQRERPWRRSRPTAPAASASASRPARRRSATGTAPVPLTIPHRRHPRPHPDRPGPGLSERFRLRQWYELVRFLRPPEGSGVWATPGLKGGTFPFAGEKPIPGLIGSVSFVDSISRPIFLDADGRQHVLGDDGRHFGIPRTSLPLLLAPATASVALVVGVPNRQVRRVPVRRLDRQAGGNLRRSQRLDGSRPNRRHPRPHPDPPGAKRQSARFRRPQRHRARRFDEK